MWIRIVCVAWVAMVVSCGGGKSAAPPAKPAVRTTTDPPATPAVATKVEPPPAVDPGAVWGERVERAFTALTASLVPSPPRATAEAAWTALGGSASELPADDAALATALRRRATEQIGKKALPPERVWAAIAAMTDVADNAHVML